jgi:hypothetical protein
VSEPGRFHAGHLACFLRHEVFLQAAKDCLQATNEKKTTLLVQCGFPIRLVWLGVPGAVPHTLVLNTLNPLLISEKPLFMLIAGVFGWCREDE